MKAENLIERYMSQLDQYLAHIPVTEKSEIILELNAHIQDSLNNGEKDIEEILSSLGTPQEAARRYLEERGLSINYSLKDYRKTETGKWVTVSLLGSLGMVMAFSIFVMLYFSPLVDVKKEDGSVKLLGGLINVQKDMDKRKNKKIKAHLEFKGLKDGVEKAVEIKIGGKTNNPKLKVKIDGLDVDGLKELEGLELLEDLQELSALDDLDKIESLGELKELKKLEELKNLKIFKDLKKLKGLKLEIKDSE